MASPAFAAGTDQPSWSHTMKSIIVRAAIFAAAACAVQAHAAGAPAAGAPAAGAPAAESGRWITESGNLEIDIAPCGEALCGTVVRVIANRSMSRPGADMQAADGRSAIGMQVLSGFMPSGNGEWKGQIYNREDGQTYDCLIELLAPGQLKVRAYKGLPLFGKTQVWRRTSEVPGEPQ
jgi:uncharacterized protein (DUF2147 family)